MHFEELVTDNAVLKGIKYCIESDSWDFCFENEIALKEVSFWRVLKDGKIKSVSNDHGQKFGRKEPIDLEVEIKNSLQNSRLLKILRNQSTGDLRLELENNFTIEVFTHSSGYECWNLQTPKNNFIGLGMGEIQVISNGQK